MVMVKTGRIGYIRHFGCLCIGRRKEGTREGTKERMEELVLEYVQVGNDVNPNGYVVEEYLFSEEYLLGNIFFTTDTLYTILWDCFICTDSYLTLKDQPLNQANPYIVAIPLYEFKVKGS